jgi:F0F1-type ATP synthase delta subunit
MKTEYAHAFLEVLKDGMPVETALPGLKSALAKKQHSKLFGPVLLEVLRVLEAHKGVKQAVVSVTKESDMQVLKEKIEAILVDLGVAKDTPIKTTIDKTLVGGFVATFDYKEYDQSYKKALTSLYESIIK